MLKLIIHSLSVHLVFCGSVFLCLSPVCVRVAGGGDGLFDTSGTAETESALRKLSSQSSNSSSSRRHSGAWHIYYFTCRVFLFPFIIIFVINLYEATDFTCVSAVVALIAFIVIISGSF